MKTDHLIAMLASGPVGADLRLPARRILFATAAGLFVAAAAMLVFLGPRPDLAAAVQMPMFWLKLAVPGLLMAASYAATSRLARPGDRARGAGVAIAAVLALLWMAAAVDLGLAAQDRRGAMIEGASAWPCVAGIALLSLPLLFAIFMALRNLAPTRPAIAGLCAGALSGSAAALVYAVHCNETAVPFLAIWYIVGIAAPAILGAVAGPRLLRWA